MSMGKLEPRSPNSTMFPQRGPVRKYIFRLNIQMLISQTIYLGPFPSPNQGLRCEQSHFNDYFNTRRLEIGLGIEAG